VDKEYLLSRVNAHGVIAVSGGMWLLMFFESYPLWVTFFFSVAHTSIPELEKFFFGYQWYGWVASIPALLLILTALRRLPEAGALVRRGWAAGRYLLTMGIILHLAGAVAGLLGADRWNPWPERGMLMVLILHLLLLVYLWSSSYSRAVFREFPEASSK